MVFEEVKERKGWKETPTDTPVPPFLAYAEHRNVPSIRHISMYALFTYDNTDGFRCRSVARKCLHVAFEYSLHSTNKERTYEKR